MRRGLVGKKYLWGDGIDGGKANYNENVGDTTVAGEYPLKDLQDIGVTYFHSKYRCGVFATTV